MPNEDAGERRTQPVRITHMTIAPGDPRGLEEGPQKPTRHINCVTVEL
jgi:hypothetical protein